MNRIKLAREGSLVKRLHTTQIHGDYLVGQHSFNMLVMLRQLWPDAPKRLIWAILEHDLGERWTGDVPAPAKWLGVLNRANSEELEDAYLCEIFKEGPIRYFLTDEERKWMAGLDILEFYCFCKDQLLMGNLAVVPMVETCEKIIPEGGDKFAPEVIELFFEISRNPWLQQPDFPEETNDG